VPTSRLEAFSDGVFAIAITLLIFNIKAPDNTDHLVASLLKLWPSYLAYVISFLLIGLLWANHHVMFEHIIKTDRTQMFVNTLLLMVVAFIPFTASVLASAFRNGAGESVAIALYGGTLVLGGLCFNGLWSHAYRAQLMDDSVTSQRMRRMTRRILFGPIAYAVGGIVGYFEPVAGVVIFGVLILYYWLPIPQRNSAGQKVGSR
jgi:uncharacterized membrane protein